MRGARRWTFQIHRWLGVAIAALLLLWTLSGFVMMYVAYPATSSAERSARLAPLALAECCSATNMPEGPVQAAAVEMLAGRPVLRWIGEGGPDLLDLRSGAPVAVGKAEVAAIAREFVGAGAGEPVIEPVEVDQWTLQSRRYAPLSKASFGDAAGSTLYVSALTGQVVVDTTRHERFWNWLGAVPHWLYFTPLRKDGWLWGQVVIWTSLLGVFLTVTGLYIGVVTLTRSKRGHGFKSPFRGVALWHHWTGLIFGIVTLTWVLSGLFSMNPWGAFESQGPIEEIPNLAGRPLDGADVAALVAALKGGVPPGVVSAQVTVQAGKAWAILIKPDGSRVRASLPDLAPAPPTEAELLAQTKAAKPTTALASAALQANEDAYHYSHKADRAVLPVFRAIYANADKTRIYLDPRTGELAGFVDAEVRGFRWWHLALHRLDLPGLNARPLWDIVMWPLMLGVTLVCGLGLWMGVRRLKRTVWPRRR